MLVIRLARTGRKKYPTYRIVAADSRRAAIGKFVMILGHYNPHTKELVIKKEAIEHYLGNGAQPSNAVIKLLQKEKVALPDWVELKTRNRAPKKEVEPVAEASAQADETSKEEPAQEEAPATDTSIAQTAEAQVEAVEENQPAKDEAETADQVAAESEAAKEASEAAAEVADASDEAKA